MINRQVIAAVSESIDCDQCAALLWLRRRESMQKQVAELKGKLATTTQQTLSAEERSQMIDAAMAAEEKRQETLQNEMSQMSAVKFKRYSGLSEMKLQKRHMDTEIQVILAGKCITDNYLVPLMLLILEIG